MIVKDYYEIINALNHDMRYVDENGNTIIIASDAVINNLIFNRFYYYDFLTYTPDKCRQMLTDHINKNRYKFIELYKTTLYDYNPIWNVDGSEKETTTTEYGHKIISADARAVTSEQTTSGTTETTHGLKVTTAADSDEKLTHGQTVNNIHSDSGYNSASPVTTTTDAETNAGTDETKTTNSGTVTNSGTDKTTTNAGKNVTTNSGNVTDTHSGKDITTIVKERGGNIGVTMTQQLIEAERNIIIDVVNMYVDSFGDCFNVSTAGIFEMIKE